MIRFDILHIYNKFQHSFDQTVQVVLERHRDMRKGKKKEKKEAHGVSKTRSLCVL